MEKEVSQVSKSFLWSFMQQISTQLVNFLVMMVLARILLPEDFGVIALFGVFISIATLLVDGGFTISLIRKQNINEIEYNTIFWYNLLMSLVIYILLFVLSPYIADFYKTNELTLIIRVYSLSIILGAIVSIQKVKFNKNLQFKELFYINFPIAILSGALGIALSIHGVGVWSLVYMYLFTSLITTFFYYIKDPFIPKFEFDIILFKEHFNFGFKITMANLIDTLFINAYPLIIGKNYSTIQVGFYNRADNLKQLPVRNITDVINRVSLPLFAKIQNDNEKLRNLYKIFTKGAILIIAPILCIMILCSKEIIVLLFTEKWLGMAPLLSIVCLSSILNPLQGFNLNILQIKNKSNLFLGIEIVKKIFELIIILITFRYNIEILLWGQFAYCIIAFIINSYFTGSLINYSTWQQIRDIFPILLINFFLFIILKNLKNIVITDIYSSLVVIILTYLSIYLAFVFVFYRNEIAIFNSMLKK